MTPEEIEAKRVADEKALADEISNSELTKLQEKLAKAEEDRDNYKTVALKRLGKLPGDADFANKDDSTELSVAEQVRLALLDREVEEVRKAEKAENARLIRENSELRLAAKNRPGSSGQGGDSGSSTEVKDNVFSESQIVTMKARAIKLKIDPETYINNAKKNLMSRG
jgi:hypothetical protein